MEGSFKSTILWQPSSFLCSSCKSCLPIKEQRTERRSFYFVSFYSNVQPKFTTCFRLKSVLPLPCPFCYRPSGMLGLTNTPIPYRAQAFQQSRDLKRRPWETHWLRLCLFCCTFILRWIDQNRLWYWSKAKCSFIFLPQVTGGFCARCEGHERLLDLQRQSSLRDDYSCLTLVGRDRPLQKYEPIKQCLRYLSMHTINRLWGTTSF